LLMKKIFTLISMALVAVGMNAQETWVADAEYEAAPGGTMAAEFTSATTSGTNMIATISKSPVSLEYVSSNNPKAITSAEGGAVDLTPENWPEAGWDAASFKVGSNNKEAQPPLSFYPVIGTGVPYVTFVSKQFWNSDDGLGDKYYPGYTGGEGLPDGWTYYNPDGSLGLPTSGSYIKATTAEAGVLKIGAFILQSNTRKFYIAKASDKKALQWTNDKNTTGYMIEGYVQGIQDSDNSFIFLSSIPVEDYLVGSSTPYEWTKADATTDSKNIQAQRKYVWFVFDAEVGETYYIFGNNWDIGFQGMKFYKGKTIKDYAPTNISTIKAEQSADFPVYNLAGQRVDDSYKGIIIQNGKKSIKK